ncbi:MAG: ATP-binding protein [Acidimicrobiia bacterium]
MSSQHRRLAPRLLAAYAVAFNLILAVVLWVDSSAGRVVGVIIGGLAGAALILVEGRRLQGEADRLNERMDRETSEAEDRARRAEEERRLLEQVLAVVRQGVVLVGEDDVIAYANQAALELVRPAEKLATLVPRRLQRLVRQARLDQTVAEGDMEHGSPVRTLRAAAVLFPADKRVLITITDVTANNRIEAVRRDFVAAASHELKTPVAAMLASAEALNLALTRDPASAQRFAVQVERSAQQLARLVSDLLDLSRVESTVIEAEPVRVDQLVQAEVSRLQGTADEAGCHLGLEAEPVRVAGNPHDLRLAVRNLLDNALRHTSSAGSVTVTVLTRDGRCAIAVSDSGEGIPQRELPRIFERFYRVDSARSRSTGGTGLGLAIVKHVAEGHGGTVTVESELGVGSSFRIDLPALVD